MSNTIENFLWCQSANPTDANLFVIDSQMSKYCQSENQLEAMSFMTSSDLKRKDKHNQNDMTSTGYEIRESSKAIQLLGNYCEVDDAGRPLVYVFTTRNKNIQKAIEILKEYSSMMKLTLRKENLDAYSHYFKSRKIKRSVAFAIGIVFITILYYIYYSVKNE